MDNMVKNMKSKHIQRSTHTYVIYIYIYICTKQNKHPSTPRTVGNYFEEFGLNQNLLCYTMSKDCMQKKWFPNAYNSDLT